MSDSNQESNRKLADAIRGAFAIELTYKEWGYELYTIPRWTTLREAIAEQDETLAIAQVNWFLRHIRRTEAMKCPTLATQQAAMSKLNAFIRSKFDMAMKDLATACTLNVITPTPE